MVYIHVCITGVYLSLNEGFLHNGSTIPYIEIGHEDNRVTEESLVCHSDKADCCETTNEGDWYLPDGSVITSNSKEFSVTRSDEGKIRLYRKTEIISSTKTLCCIVRDASDINQTVCVNSG